MILLKSPEEIALMHRASMIVAEILEELAAAVKPGITTEELDRLAEELTLRRRARGPRSRATSRTTWFIRRRCAYR